MNNVQYEEKGEERVRMGDSAGTSHGGIWRKASLKVVMFEMRSEGRGRPAERREGF